MSELSIERRMEAYRQLAKENAKAQGERARLEEFRKSKLAMLMQAAQKRGVVTAAAQEREALADPEYCDVFLSGLGDAVERAELHRYMLKAAELELELMRTAEASKRAEMRGYR